MNSKSLSLALQYGNSLADCTGHFWFDCRSFGNGLGRSHQYAKMAKDYFVAGGTWQIIKQGKSRLKKTLIRIRSKYIEHVRQKKNHWEIRKMKTLSYSNESTVNSYQHNKTIKLKQGQALNWESLRPKVMSELRRELWRNRRLTPEQRHAIACCLGARFRDKLKNWPWLRKVWPYLLQMLRKVELSADLTRRAVWKFANFFVNQHVFPELRRQGREMRG